MMKIKAKTNYFGAKKAIHQAIKIFSKNSEKLFLEVTIVTEESTFTVIFRREIIAHWMKFDFFNMDQVPDIYFPQNKKEVVELWNLLIANQEPVKEAKEKWGNFMQL